MERAKNAMYAQAGKIRGWVQVTPAVPVSESPVVPMPMPMPVPIPVPAPVVTQVIPAPPVIRLSDLEPEMNMPMSAEICTLPVMAHVPGQTWQKLYEIEQGFHRGTIFMELDLPFIGEGACRNE